nr:hypothetical protein [Tanacetum cinerariifolium]
MKRESRGFSGVETTLFPTMLVIEQVSHGEGPTSPIGTQHTPIIIESSPHLKNISITYRQTRTRTRRMDISISLSNVPSSAADKAITKEMHAGLGRATTTVSSLEVEQGSGPHYSHQRVKKLEKKLKHKRRRVVIVSSEDEEASLDHKDSPKQERMIEEIDKDKIVNLCKSSEQGEAHEKAEHIMDFSTASPQKNDDETLAETLLNIKRSAVKVKGKVIMKESKL